MKFLRRFFKFFSRIVLPRVIVIGFDIQDTHIAVVASLRKGDKVKPLASSVIDLPDEAIQNGEIKNPEMVRVALSKLINQMPAYLFNRLKGEPVFVLSIPPHHIYTETALFPLMNENDLGEAVRLKIETSLPWSLPDTYYDWIEVPVLDKGQKAVFISAASRHIIDDYLRVFLEIGWNVSACEFHMLSLASFLGKVNTPFVFILQDEDGLECAFFCEGKITTHLLRKLRPDDDVNRVLKDQLRNIFVFAESNFNITPEEAYFCNRATGIPLPSFIDSNTQLSVNPFPFPQDVDARFVIARGASEREYGVSETSLSLLPEESSGRFEENLLLKTMSLWSNIFLAFIVTFLLAFGALWAFAINEEKAVLKEIVNKRSLVEQQFANAQTLIESARAFNVLVNSAGASTGLTSHMGEKLSAINAQIEKSGVYFKSARMEEGNNQIIATFSSPSSQNISALKNYLEATKIFSSLIVPVVPPTSSGDVTVDITLK